MNSFKVGWGEQKITPNGKIVIAGGAPFRITDTVHDDLKAVAMVVQSENGRIIWVSCDFCHPTKQVEEQIIDMLYKEIPDFKAEQLILSGTHATACFYLSDREFLDCGKYIDNSEVPMPFDEARKQFCEGVVKAIIEAMHNLEEEEIAYSSIDILTGFCRMVQYKDGSAEMYGDVNRPDFLKMEFPDGGPTRVVYFYDKANHKLKGIFANVPCPAQADETSKYITSDYWGVVRNQIEDKLGKDVKVLATCRAAGELSPHKLIPNIPSEWGREKTEILGNWIAKHIIDAEKHPDVTYKSSDLSFNYITKEASFPFRDVSESDYKGAKNYLNSTGNNPCYKWGEDFNAVTKVKLYEAEDKHYSAKVSVVKLSDIIFFTAPVELFSEYAHRISAKFPKLKMLDVQLTHDSMGYLPTKEAIRCGGYSTLHFSTITDYHGGEIYIEEICNLVNELNN